MKNTRILASLVFATLTLGPLAGSSLADHPSRPVQTTKEAMTVARQWGAEAKLAGLTLGEIKTFSLVYSVDIVEADEPDLHANHLIIRKDDGFAALVYPAHDAPKMSREHRLGLEGLAGMSGMTGMSGATQPSPKNRIGNDLDARRHVTEWLKANDLGESFALEDVISMNNVFLVDLHDKKTHKLLNQAVVRGVDGYVSLVRPVKQSKASLPNFSPARQ